MIKFRNKKENFQKMKKVTALLLTICLVCSLSGCAASAADTSYVLSVGGKHIPAGVYILDQEQEYEKAKAKFKELNPDTKTDDAKFNWWGQSVEGKPFAQYINDNALKASKEREAYNSLYDDLGLTLGATELKQSSDTAASMEENFKEQMDKWGISQNSYRYTMESMYKINPVFDGFYGEKGKEPVPQQEITDKFVKDYVRYRDLTVTIQTTDDDTKKKQLEEQANGYVTRLNNGESFTKLRIESASSAETIAANENKPAETYTAEQENENDEFSKTTTDTPLVKFILTLPVGKAGLFTDEQGYHVVVRLDPKDNTSYVKIGYDQDKDGNVRTVEEIYLHELRDDAMQKKIDDKIASLNITVNEQALKRYQPQHIEKVENKLAKKSA
jgi:hypothetical protein